MNRERIRVGQCECEVLTAGDSFLGLGRIWIGDMLVRSGRLPLLPASQSFLGLETAGFRLLAVEETPAGIAIRLSVGFRRALLRQATDYHLERVYDTADWDGSQAGVESSLTLHLAPATDTLGGLVLAGFRYWWDYAGPQSLFWLMDRASWEIDGDIRGATAWSQCLCAPPVITFADDTAWTTEELIPEADCKPGTNPVISQFWPRWMGHQSFDYQFKAGATLVGLFDGVGLIRSAQRREPGAAELKTFDRHIFNESARCATTPKSILLNVAPRTAAAERDLWSAVYDETNRRAREEIGAHEIPASTCLSWNFWKGHTFDSYRTDLLPAAANCGVESIFIDNVNRSNATEGAAGNQCQSHDYQVAEKLGGPDLLKRLVSDGRAAGVRVYSWTSTAQSPDSPLFKQHRGTPGWFVKMEDGRQVFGGTHSTEFQFQNLAHEPARRNWVEGLLKTRDLTGLDGYFFDMAMNVSFAPISYEGLHPSTQWRETLSAIKALQDGGVELDGLCPPFVRPGQMYDPSCGTPESLFLNYRMVVAFPGRPLRLWTPAEMFRVFAYGSIPALHLFYDKARIDTIFTDEHRRILREFRECRPLMRVRKLSEDDTTVTWLREDGTPTLVCDLCACRIKRKMESETKA